MTSSLGWVRHYDRGWLRKDVVGGVTAGAVVILQAMAYATIANLPLEVGLYTCNRNLLAALDRDPASTLIIDLSAIANRPWRGSRLPCSALARRG